MADLDGPDAEDKRITNHHAHLVAHSDLIREIYSPKLLDLFAREMRFLRGLETEDDRRRAEEGRLTRAQEAEKARVARAEQREWAPLGQWNMEALIERLGIGHGFAQHLLQSYCTCRMDSEGGWYLCGHARDLGIEENS